MPEQNSKILDEDLSNLHVLLVDDDAAFLDILESLVRAIGVNTVTRAKSGSEASDKLAKTDRVVDCILCDYDMAPGNGLQLLQAVRLGKIKYLRADVPYILVTALATPELVAVAAALDVSGYLIKPATRDKIRTAIARARGKYFALDMNRYAGVLVPI